MITELLFALTLSGPLLPQDTSLGAPTAEPIRVGVVLSGGSAKGFAHVGVLRLLEQAGIRVQAITGTSMGGLIGGLYALGYTPEQLEQLTLSQDWGALFGDAVHRRDVPALRKFREDQTLFTLPLRNGRPQLPAGLVRGQRITQLVTRLTWNAHEVRDFSRLPIPFVAVATDIESGEAVPLRGGFLPEAIRASIGFPGAFYPVRVNGRLLVDGVLARNLPAQDAQELGATFLICSDVSAPLIPADSIRTLVDVLNQAISFRAEESNRRQRELCDILIRPDIEGISSLAFDRAAEWIERGEKAARDVWPALREVAAETPEARPRERLSGTPDSVRVTALNVVGTEQASRAMVRRALGIEVPGWLTPEAIGAAMDRVYATGLFGSVRYRLESGPDPSTKTLVVDVKEESLDRVGFAFRYESEYRASLLTTVEVSDFLSYGTTLKFRLRLGNQIQFGAQLLRIAELVPRINLSGGLEFNSTPLDVFEGGARVGAANVDVWSVSLFTGIGLGNDAMIGFRWKGEYAETVPTVGADGFDSEELFHTVAATVNIDTRHRTLFPDRGVHILGKSELASRAIGSSLNFSHHVVDADFHLPVLDFLSLGLGGIVGTTTGGGLPPHYLFFAGGANSYAVFPQRQIPFLGLSVQELAGRHVQVVRVGLTVEPLPNVFVGLAWNAGEAMDEWRFEPERYVHGGAVSLGVLSPFGMARLTASKAEREEPRIEIDLGYPF